MSALEEFRAKYPANDNAPFRVRTRSIKDKATGREIRVLNVPKRHASLEKLLEYARETAEINKSGVAAFFLCSFDHEMTPCVSAFIADHIPIGFDVLSAAASEAFRSKRAHHWIKNLEDEDDPPCA